MNTFKHKNSLRTIEAEISKKVKKNEARPKFTGSYKKKRVCLCLKRKKTVFFRVPCFICMYFVKVPNWPKIRIFVGLEFSSTIGPPRHIFSGSPDPGTKCRAKLFALFICVFNISANFA